MSNSAWLILWGSPVGLAIFFAGLGILLWGVGQQKRRQLAQRALELKERQYEFERSRAMGGSA